MLFVSVVACENPSTSGNDSLSDSSSSVNTNVPAGTIIYFVGDSTVCEYSQSGESGRYTMRNGYGMRVGEYLTGDFTINNLALSGRSSKSFLTENNYKTLKNNIKKGDYLVIGFGHNDQKPGVDKFTDPTKPIDDPTSFQYSLYENYIKLAQSVEATPILCTPIVRRDPSSNYLNDKIHIANGGDYRQNIVDLGAAKNVTVIDLTTLTKELFTNMPTSDSAKYFSWQISADNSKTVTVDNTHLNAFGAQVVAKMFVEEIAKTDCSLKSFIKSELPTPNYSVVVEKQGNFTMSIV